MTTGTTKTTVYLPVDLKVSIEREARRRGVAEAEVIRSALVAGLSRPMPHAGIITGPPIAEQVDELLGGFGDR